MLLTPEKLAAAVGCTLRDARAWSEPLSNACRLYEITTPARLSAFLAQIGHESMGLARVVENLGYSAGGLLKTWPTRFDQRTADELARKPEAIANFVYGGRLGNKEPGDGWRYRGRGLVMVTGRANYEAVTELLMEHLPTVPDFVINPEQLELPEWAAMSAAAYWSDRDLNTLADLGQFSTITRRINGGTIGAADRNARYAQARKVLA